MRNPGSEGVTRWLCSLAAADALDGEADADLLRRFVRDRDEPAFTALLRRHGPMVHGVCRRLLRDPHAAEDAFQATFLVLARRASSVADPRLLANWLYGVAHRTALQARKTPPSPGDEGLDRLQGREREPTEELAGRELLAALDEEVRRLPAKYRRAVVLCCLRGHSYAEAARLLGCPLGTVASWLARARERLATRLGRRGFAVTASLLAEVLVADRLGAAVPAALSRATLAGVGGLPDAARAVSPRVFRLYNEVSTAMMRFRLVLAAAVLLALAAVGAGALGLRAFAGKDPPKSPGSSGQGSKQTGGSDSTPPKYPSFRAVAFYGTGRVVVKQTGRELVQVKDGDGTRTLRDVEVKKGTLILGRGPQPGFTAEGVDYTVEVKELTGLYLIGNGKMETSAVKTKRLAVSVSGLGDVTVTGSADTLEVSLTGNGNFRGDQLKTRVATIRHSGLGNAVVCVSKQLDAVINGIGTVEYVGNPTVRRGGIGLGAVRKKR